jgi:hypothetical protein
VQDDVERNFLVSQTEGSKYLLGIVYVDIAHDGKTEETHRL